MRCLSAYLLPGLPSARTYMDVLNNLVGARTCTYLQVHMYSICMYCVHVYVPMYLCWYIVVPHHIKDDGSSSCVRVRTRAHVLANPLVVPRTSTSYIRICTSYSDYGVITPYSDTYTHTHTKGIYFLWSVFVYALFSREYVHAVSSPRPRAARTKHP